MMILYHHRHHHFVHTIEQQMEPRTRIEKRTGKRPGVLRQLPGDDELLLDCRIQRLKSDQSRNSSFYEEVERTDLERWFFLPFWRDTHGQRDTKGRSCKESLQLLSHREKISNSARRECILERVERERKLRSSKFGCEQNPSLSTS